MADFVIKENTGSIFKNDYKKDNEKAPDYKGKCNVNGKEMEISCWINEGKDGKKYFGVTFSEPYVKPNEDSKPEQEQSDLPF